MLSDYYLHIKALHLIFMVTWFAGLFYIVRLFVYTREAQDRNDTEKAVLVPQFLLMQKRLWYGITWPSAILILIFGISMLLINPALLKSGWMHVKLTMVALLLVYHHWCHFEFKRERNSVFKYSSMTLRIMNEVATIFLVGIIFLAVLRNALSMVYGLVGLLLLTVLLFLAIRLYKKIRTSKEN